MCFFLYLSQQISQHIAERGDHLYTSDSDDPRTLMVVDQYRRYSNKSERDNEDDYDNFKLKKIPSVCIFYTKICQRGKGVTQ